MKQSRCSGGRSLDVNSSPFLQAELQLGDQHVLSSKHEVIGPVSLLDFYLALLSTSPEGTEFGYKA